MEKPEPIAGAPPPAEAGGEVTETPTVCPPEVSENTGSPAPWPANGDGAIKARVSDNTSKLTADADATKKSAALSVADGPGAPRILDADAAPSDNTSTQAPQQGVAAPGEPPNFDDFVLGTLGGSEGWIAPNAALTELFASSDLGGTLDLFGARESGTMPAVGRCEFTLKKLDLQRVLVLTANAVGPDRQQPELVKLTVLGSHLRAQSCDVASFVECLAPLEVATDEQPSEPLAFAVAHANLEVAARAVEDQVTFVLDLAAKHLQLTSGTFERPILLHDLKRFTQPSPERIGPDVAGKIVDAATLKAALAYVTPAVPPDDIPEMFTVVALRDGTLLGGSGAAIAAASAPELAEHALSARRRFLVPLAEFLGLLERPTLVDTGRFYILRDDWTAYGFEKPTATFPMEPVWHTPPAGRDRLLVPRQTLCDVLHLLQSAAGGDEDGLLVRFKVNASSGNTRGTFSIRTSTGKSAHQPLKMTRRDAIETRLDLRLPLDALVRALESGRGLSAYLDVYAERSVLIVDDDPGEARNFRTVLPISGPKVAKRTPAAKAS